MGREELLETIIRDVRRLEKHVRLGEEWLFIKEESFDYIARIYCERQGRENPSRQEVKSAQQEIIKQSRGGLQYIVEEEQCLSGRCLQINKEERSKLYMRIPIIEAQLLPCRDHLHPKDPYFRERQDIKLYPAPRYVARITIKGKKFMVPTKVFESFIEQARESRRTKKYFNSRLSARRKCLVVLAKLLGAAQKTNFYHYAPREIDKKRCYYHNAPPGRNLPWYFQISEEFVQAAICDRSSYWKA